MNTVASILSDKNITSKQIVRVCQVSLPTACCWLRGASVPNVQYIRDLATLSNTRYSRLMQARENSKTVPRTPPWSGQKKQSDSVVKKTVKKTVKSETSFIPRPKAIDPKEHAERCKHLMMVSSVYATLSEEEKVVVGLMADALSLLDNKGGESNVK
tara:strand:+ start:1848 stop:2318 length:471 start_codon:yes stop_codon:yes gene_type:complete